MLVALRASPDAVARVVKAVRKRGAGVVAADLAAAEGCQEPEVIQQITRHLQSLRDPRAVQDAYDHAVAIESQQPVLVAFESLGIHKNRGSAMDALLQHEPFIRDACALATGGIGALRKLGVGQRSMGLLQAVVEARGVEVLPPPKRHRVEAAAAAAAAAIRASRYCLLVAETRAPSSFAVLLTNCLEKSGVQCTSVPLEGTAQRRKRCKLPAATVRRVWRADLVLVEDLVYHALEGTEERARANLVAVPALDRWHEDVDQVIHRLRNAEPELVSLLRRETESAAAGMWGALVVLVPVRSQLLDDAGVQQVVVSTSQQAEARLSPPRALCCRQVRSWGFCREQGAVLWQLLQRFDQLSDEVPEEVRFLGSRPGEEFESSESQPNGVVFLHDASGARGAEASAKELGATAALMGGSATLEQLRVTAAAATLRTSRAAGVVLCGPDAERHGSLVVAPGVPIAKWSDGLDLRNAFARHHALDEGVKPASTLELLGLVEDLDPEFPAEVAHHFAEGGLVGSRLDIGRDSEAVIQRLAIVRDQCAALQLPVGALDLMVRSAHHKTVVGRAPSSSYLAAFLDHLTDSPRACARWELRRLAHEADSAFAQQVQCVRIEPSMEAIKTFLEKLREATGDAPGLGESRRSTVQALRFYGAWTWEPNGFTGTLTQPATLEPEEFLVQAARRASDSTAVAQSLSGMAWSTEAPVVMRELLRRGHVRRTDSRMAWTDRLYELLTEENTPQLEHWARSDKVALATLLEKLEGPQM